MLEHPKASETTKVKLTDDVTMGNQQENPSTEELAWLAGIIEGEGSISMNARKKSWNGWNGIGVDVNITIANTDSGIIYKSVGIFRKLGVEPKILEKDCNPIVGANGRTYHNPEKVIMYISVGKFASAHSILTAIIPFMAGQKLNRAKLMVEFIGRRMSKPKIRDYKGQSQSTYDQGDWALVSKFYDETGAKLLPEVRVILNDYTKGVSQEAVI